MMIVSVLVRILHASPDTIMSIFNAVPALGEYFDPKSLTAAVSTVNTFNPVELLLVIFIVWMARRFFASVFASMIAIFQGKHHRKPVVNQILAIAFELIVIFTVIMIIFSFTTLKTIINQPIFHDVPQFAFIQDGFLSGRWVQYLPNILIFAAVTLLYWGSAGTKPSMILCAATSFGCTVSFWVFRFVMHLFLNVGKYNLIYGFLGHAIILFMDIYFFFMFYLFFAQMIFVYQFFDELLLGELYLLPKQDDCSWWSSLRRALFIRPDYLIANDTNIIHLDAGQSVFEPGDTDLDAYYIVHGQVAVKNDNGTDNIFSRGDFFGELNCILGSKRTGSACAVDSAQIVRIDGDTFRSLAQKNPVVTNKVMSQISSYFTMYLEHDELL